MKVRRSVLTRSTALATLLSLIVTSCGGRTRTPTGALDGASPLPGQVLVQDKDVPEGLDLRVSDGKQGIPAVDRARLAPATKLADAAVQALLARARPLPADPDRRAGVRAARAQQARAPHRPDRDRQLPAGVVLVATPPAASTPGAGLRVLRFMPEGPVPLAPELSVTFSLPMVAVTSQDGAATVTPVKLTPQPPGQWRWIGTRTILFDPTIRFPMATTYQVEVPAGTRAAGGDTLAQATRFTFETPAPAVIEAYPGDGQPQKLDVPMALVFDQRIDPLAVVDKLRVTANGDAIPVRLLARAEIAQDKRLAGFVDGVIAAERDGRWLAFRATRPFPKDAQIEVIVPPGTPSAEGPNRTVAPQRQAFRTFPPLEIVRAECGWGSECRPGMPFQFELNNPLDEDRFDPAQLTVTPAIPDVQIGSAGQTVSVTGLTTARTTYKVTVSGGLVDAFGQTLGKDSTHSFAVGDAYPAFFGPNGTVVLDPAAKRPSLEFFSTGYEQLVVRLYKVTPRDHDAYLTYVRNQWNKDKPPALPGTKISDEKVATRGGKNKLVETSVDLTRALGKGGLGHVIAVVEPSPWTEAYDPPRLISWVQSTKLGIDAHVDAGALIAMATELATGKPAAGVGLEVRPFGLTATTRADGTAELPLVAQAPRGAHVLVATRGDDTAFVTDDTGMWSEGGTWAKETRARQLSWYVIDDRKLYKPGEEVSLKGWLRVIDPNEQGDLTGIAGAVTAVTFTATDSRGTKLATGTAKVSVAGGFDARFTLPKTPNLGSAQVQLETTGAMRGSHGHGFQIEEFRRPEFEVAAQASQGPFMVGGGGDVTVKASYFAGGPLAGAPASWFVTASPTSFTPPNRDDYVFGAWVPWWGGGMGGGGRGGWGGGPGFQPARTWSHTGTTDATGAHTLHLEFLSARPARPMSVVANASVTDVNRQTWTASSVLLVHPSSRYVGLKMKRPFVDKGTPFSLDVIGVDLDGKAAVGTPIEVKAVRVGWAYKQGTYQRVDKDPQACAVVAAEAPARCDLATTEGGMYEVTAVIADDQGRRNETTLDVLGQRRRPAAGARGHARGGPADPRQAGLRGRRRRGVAGAGAILPGRGARHVAPVRHRQGRADHAGRPDDDHQGPDHRRDGAQPGRAGRSGRRRGAHP